MATTMQPVDDGGDLSEANRNGPSSVHLGDVYRAALDKTTFCISTHTTTINNYKQYGEDSAAERIECVSMQVALAPANN